MPTKTYDLIASNVLGSSTSSVTFSSIPATYRDLVLVINALGSGGAILARYNGDTGSNYRYVRMFGDGSTTYAGSFSGTSVDIGIADNTGNTSILHINDYAVTDKHKTSLSRSNDPNYVWVHCHRWINTAAINQITVLGSTFTAGSTFYLYGIVS